MINRRLHIINIIRGFLSKLINKEFLVFLFFLLLSGLFWLTNVLDDYYEREFTVDVRLAGIPKNVVITSDIDSVVRVVVRDKGYVIAICLMTLFVHCSLTLMLVLGLTILVRSPLPIYNDYSLYKCIRVRK